MLSDTTFFTGTIDPDTGDIRSRRIDTQRPMQADDLVVDVHYSRELPIDPTNADPTLSQFHEPRKVGSDGKED